jgi:putative MATE family efflux protein
MKDKEFYKKFLALSVPIALQQLLKALMHFIDNIMIGSLGEDAIVGVGDANQIAFFIIVAMFGVCSAGWVFAARFHGEGDTGGIKSTLGLCLIGTFIIGFVFFVLALVIPEGLISIFNQTPGVVESGSEYIRIVGISYIFTGISQAYANVLKGCQRTRIPVVTGFISVSVNACINYALIGGNWGFPALGVQGAAIGTVVGSLLDAALIVIISYLRGNEAKAKLSELFPGIARMGKLMGEFIKVGMPIIINETMWALYSVALVILYNKMGVGVAAAMSVAGALDRLAYVVYMGIANTSGVMIGNQLGEGDREKAYIYARRFLRMAPLSTVAVGALVLLALPLFLAQYDITAATSEMVRRVVYINTALAWVIMINNTNIIGVLRGGGDTRFAAMIDLAGCWALTLPVAYITALALRLPIYVVYPCAMLAGESFKLIFGLRRFLSGKWMHDITSAIRAAD